MYTRAGTGPISRLRRSAISTPSRPWAAGISATTSVSAGFVAGIEGDASYAGSKAAYSALGASGEIESTWKGSVRGRFGLTFGLSLAYVTAGYAWTEATVTEASAAGTHSSTSTTFDGVVYGAGLESYVLPGLSVRLEALRFDYGSQELSFGSGTSALQDLDLDDTVVRAGVTFHFN